MTQPLTIQIKQPVRVKFLPVRKTYLKVCGTWVRSDIVEEK